MAAFLDELARRVARRGPAAFGLLMEPLARDADGQAIAPLQLVHAYTQGVFPMADAADGPFSWYRPQRRAILTPANWHVPASVRRAQRNGRYEVVFDQDFELVMRACAARPETWISEDLVRLYYALFQLGVAHCVQARDRETGDLAGGLYGVALGGVFCGESMFHRRASAAHVCLVALTERLWSSGFVLQDIQQLTAHMQRFGAYEVPAAEYDVLLAAALAVSSNPAFAAFAPLPPIQ